MNLNYQNTHTSHFNNLSLPLIQVQNFSVKYPDITALDRVSLQVQAGDILFITGKSGAGKTTLMRALAGEVSPSSGLVKFQSGDVFVSQVFQDLKLMMDLTIEQNLYFAFDKKVYQSKKEFEKDMMAIAKTLGVWERRSISMRAANGGLKQKVAIIRSLLCKPDVILADEPTSALDKESAAKVFEVYNYFNVKRSTTIIWATHNRELIKSFPGKIAHLDNGKLVHTGRACFI